MNENVRKLFPDPARLREERERSSLATLGLPRSAIPRKPDEPKLTPGEIEAGIVKLYRAGRGLELCVNWSRRSAHEVRAILDKHNIPIHPRGRSAPAQYERAQLLAIRVSKSSTCTVAREEGMTRNALACLLYRWGLGEYGPKSQRDKRQARLMWREFRRTRGLTVEALAKKRGKSVYVTRAWLRWHARRWNMFQDALQQDALQDALNEHGEAPGC